VNSQDRVVGTTQSAERIREMFGRLAPRYDFLNHLLSFNADRFWRAAAVRAFRGIVARPEAVVLDLCCGTGDLMRALQAAGPARVYGADFCHPMLVLANKKLRAARLLEADALQLPFPGASFDLVTVGFGFRNLANYDAGLREIHRVLRPGGTLGILEFNEVTGPIAPLYRLYSTRILPRLGGAISGDKKAYSYLPASIAHFPSAEELVSRMRDAGFSDASYRRFLFGGVCLHVGVV
jgi:demethylmenaquinone methyltransferase/2-methoxy-6-polyprenyl-1,4-benzoquinol methylase